MDRKTALFSTTDRGGAGIAAMRLLAGFTEIGVDAKAYVQYQLTDQPHIHAALPDDPKSVLARVKESQRIQNMALAPYPQRPTYCEMFSSSVGATRLSEPPMLDLLEDVDIFHLHWIATFLDIPADTRFLKKKKIVWTLHDMNPFTGGCHYTDGCEGFLEQCGNCPQLGSTNELDLSRQTWKRKDASYKNLDITVVAPSRWLAEEARRSPLLGRFPVHHIPYGLPLDIFKPYPKEEIRKGIDLPVDCKAFLFSADNVLNRRKGLAYLLDALAILRGEPEAENVVLMLLGSGGDEIEKLDYPVKVLGSLSSLPALAAAYAAADAVVLPTLEDNLPNVLLEALACGTPAVAFNVGGVPDIIDHHETGYLASPRDPNDLAQGLLWALREQPARSRLCRAKAMAKYQLATQAQRYVELYESLTSAVK